MKNETAVVGRRGRERNNEKGEERESGVEKEGG